MKRSFLMELGLEKKNVDSILDEYNRELEIEREKTKETSTTLNAKIEKLKTECEALKNNGDKVDNDEAITDKTDQGAYEKLKAEFSKYKEDIANNALLENATKAVQQELSKAGANPKFVELLLKDFDMDKIELDGDGKVKGWDEMSKPVIEKYSAVFGKVKNQGVDVSMPPPNDGGTATPETLKDALKQRYSGG